MVLPWSVAVASGAVVATPIASESLQVPKEQGTETVARPVVVATVAIHDAQIIHTMGNEITLLFNLFNAEGVQSGIVYGVELFEVTATGRTKVDMQIWRDEQLTLGSGETVSVAKTYQAPRFLSGTYELWVVAKTRSGLPLALSAVGTVSLTGSGDQVELAQCVVLVDAAPYALAAGVDIAAGESMELRCRASSSAAEPQQLIPQFTTYERSVYGVVAAVTYPTPAPVTIEPGSATVITMPVPTAVKPQAYDVVLQLVDGSGTVVTTPVVVHYVVQGESATLQNVVFDKDSYQAGDTAEALVTWSLAADAFYGARGGGTELRPLSLSVVMADGAGTLCTTPTVVSVSSASAVTRLAMAVERMCTSPQLLIGLADETGTQLASLSYAYTPTVLQEELQAPATVIGTILSVALLAVVIVALSIVAVRLLTYVRSRAIPAVTGTYEPTGTGQAPVSGVSGVTVLRSLTLFLCGFGLMFGVGVTPAAAATLTVNAGYDTIVFSVNTNKTTYVVDESIRVTGAAFVMGCGNAIAAGGLEVKDGQGVTQTIGVFNLDPYTEPGGSAIFDRYVAGYETIGSVHMPVRAYVTTNTTNTALGSLPLTIVCPDGSVWNGQECVSTSPEPIATVSGGNCTIAVGASSCVAPISWEIEHAATPNVRNVTTNTVYSYAETGTDELRTMTHGVNVIAAYDATTILATTPIVATCADGSAWNGAFCAADPVPTGTITATACEIPAGAATCTTNVDWEIKFATDPNVYNVTGGTPIATVAVGSGVPITLSHGSHDLEARDGMSVLAVDTAVATCAPNTTWTGSVCATNGGLTVNMTANGDVGSTVVTAGGAVDLAWTVTGTADQCVASADWGGLKSVTGGIELVSNLVTDMTFTITCSTAAAASSDTVVVQVTTLPNLQPIGLSLSPSTTFDPTTGVYDALYVQYSVRNTGGTDAAAFIDRLKLDRGADGTYEETVDRSVLTGLAAGADTPLVPLLLANNVPFGTHRVYLKTDATSVIIESMEDDNEDSFTITVAVPDPQLSLQADPTLVRSGQWTRLTWDMDTTYPMACTLRGPGVAHSFDPSLAGPAGSLMVGPLTAKSEFMLRCTEPTTATTFTASALVRVIGTIQEI